MNNEPNKPIPAQELTEKELEGISGGVALAPQENLEVPVDGDGGVTEPPEGASGFWQVGL